MGLDLKVVNLSKIAEEGFEFQLEMPETNEKLDAFITIRGSQSEKARNHARKKYNQLQTREALARKKGKEDPIQIEEAEEMAIETAVKRVISWRGIDEDGVAVPFTDENARRIFKENPWIREQVQTESDNLGNFLPKT